MYNDLKAWATAIFRTKLIFGLSNHNYNSLKDLCANDFQLHNSVP